AAYVRIRDRRLRVVAGHEIRYGPLQVLDVRDVAQIELFARERGERDRGFLRRGLALLRSDVDRFDTSFRLSLRRDERHGISESEQTQRERQRRACQPPKHEPPPTTRRFSNIRYGERFNTEESLC